MGWSEIGHKHLERYLRDSVYCNDAEEMKYLKKIVKEEFPNLNESTIEMSIKQCCGDLDMPMPTDLFVTLLKRRLDIFVK